MHELLNKHLPNGQRAFAPALISLAAAAFMAFATPSVAQDAGADVWRRGSCTTCHGGVAQGGGGGEDPMGPNLRESDLDRELMRETIACGRGEMPFNLLGAYREVSCYGIPLGNPPEGFQAGARLSAEQIDVLVEFLFEYVVGVTRVNRAACAAFYGGDQNARSCGQFPRR